MSAATLNIAERKVLKAALACVSRKGYAFLFSKADAHAVIIDLKKFYRLEIAVAKYRETKKRRKA